MLLSAERPGPWAIRLAAFPSDIAARRAATQGGERRGEKRGQWRRRGKSGGEIEHEQTRSKAKGLDEQTRDEKR